MPTLPVDLDGYTDLPAGKVANVVTYLERQPETLPDRPHPRFAVRHVERPETAAYRTLFRRVGDPWLWLSRTQMSDAELGAALASPATILLTVGDAEPVGLSEVTVTGQEAEIAIFGVVPEAIGTGAAHILMDRTISEAAARGIRRLWLHTCTFDHPAAVPFYLKRGFRPYRLAIEIFDDPRLAGHLPRSAAPHVALIEPRA